MTTVKYLEPYYLLAGKAICEAYKTNGGQGNLAGILSDALRCVRQRGPAGFYQWVNTGGPSRQFILEGLNNSPVSLAGEMADYGTAWDLTENLVQSFIYAKQQAKSLG